MCVFSAKHLSYKKKERILCARAFNVGSCILLIVHGTLTIGFGCGQVRPTTAEKTLVGAYEATEKKNLFLTIFC